MQLIEKQINSLMRPPRLPRDDASPASDIQGNFSGSKVKHSISLILFSLANSLLWTNAIAKIIPLPEILCTLALVLMPTPARKLRLTGLYSMFGVAMAGLLCFIVNLFLGGTTNWQSEFFIVTRVLWYPIIAYLYLARIVNYFDLLKIRHYILLFSLPMVIVFVFTIPGSGFSIIDRIINTNRSSRFFVPGREMAIGPTTLSLYLIPLFFMTLGQLLSTRGVQRLVGFLSITLLSISLYVLGTRFAWGSVAIGCFAGYIAIFYTKGLRKEVIFVAVVGVSLLFALYVFYQMGWSNADLERRIDSLLNPSELQYDDSLAVRETLWGEAFEQILRHPLGTGFLDFVEQHEGITDSGIVRNYNTHNEFLLMGLGTGWIGLILYLLYGIRMYVFLLNQCFHKLPGAVPEGAIGLAFLTNLIICYFFDTASNHPNSLTSAPLFTVTSLLFLLGAKRLGMLQRFSL